MVASKYSFTACTKCWYCAQRSQTRRNEIHINIAASAAYFVLVTYHAVSMSLLMNGNLRGCNTPSFESRGRHEAALPLPFSDWIRSCCFTFVAFFAVIISCILLSWRSFSSRSSCIHRVGPLFTSVPALYFPLFTLRCSHKNVIVGRSSLSFSCCHGSLMVSSLSLSVFLIYFSIFSLLFSYSSLLPLDTIPCAHAGLHRGRFFFYVEGGRDKRRGRVSIGRPAKAYP